MVFHGYGFEVVVGAHTQLRYVWTCGRPQPLIQNHVHETSSHAQNLPGSLMPNTHCHAYKNYNHVSTLQYESSRFIFCKEPHLSLAVHLSMKANY